MISRQDAQRLEAAVKSAEAGLDVEIVPCLFAQCGAYHEAPWAAAALALAAGCAGAWPPLLTLGAGMAAAALARWWAPLRRLLVGRNALEHAVAGRAKDVFFERGLSRGARRDRVLVFAGLFERRAVVLVAETVRAKLSGEAFAPALSALSTAAARGRAVDGMVEAVARVGRILREAGSRG
ncbi:MAG: hypothetical protein KGO96_12930 [Elusimicrobia bacterium]|nr:hypothetical protein [Elusimicrobiota bacterium]MDE2237526.1 hypothetical protein [Elusimicrobiota bacterium]MDE2426799.1 hypothetical protein [Elusimicrobiota bacterium]